jgi:hypothetical protein
MRRGLATNSTGWQLTAAPTPGLGGHSPRPLSRWIWRERWPPLTSVAATAHVLAGLPLVVVVAAVATVVAVLVPVLVVMVMVMVMVTAKETTSEDVRD